MDADPDNDGNCDLNLPIVNKRYPVFAQIVVGFAFGIALSPWSTGILFVLGFFLVYELLIYTVTEGEKPYWNWLDRGGIISAYLLGWIVGRYLAGWRDVFAEKPNDPYAFEFRGFKF